MARRKPGLTLERHRQIGAELHGMRERLVSLSVEIANCYPVASTAGRLALRVHAGLDALRCELDDCVCRENPGLPGMTRVYYRGPSQQPAPEQPDEAVRVVGDVGGDF